MMLIFYGTQEEIFLVRGELLGNSEVCIWLFFLLLNSLEIILFVKAVKELWMEKEKDRDTFYFGGLRLFYVEEYLSEPAEIGIVS